MEVVEAMQKMATIEERIKLDAKLNIWDRALIISDLFGCTKESALDYMLIKRAKRKGLIK